VVVTAALVGGHLGSRFGQAAVLGELLAGMMLGGAASAIGVRFIATDPYLDINARVGMLMLLFGLRRCWRRSLEPSRALPLVPLLRLC
jgi:Kef-type K+ transport system membrane component KefB